MSLRGYVPKTRPALWTKTYPDQRQPVRQKTPEKRGPIRRPERDPRPRPARYGQNGGAIGHQSPPRRRIRARTSETARRNRLYLARRAAFLARPENRLCEACMMAKELIKKYNDEPLPATQVHHPRGRAKTRRVDLLLHVPLWCAVSAEGHAWIDANRDKARALGLLAAKGDWGRTDDLPADSLDIPAA